MYTSLPFYQETFPDKPMIAPANKSAIHPGANTTLTPRLNEPYCIATSPEPNVMLVTEAAESNTCAASVHLRYCSIVGIASPESVFIDKDGSNYTARIDFATVVLSGTGQYVGKGGLVKRRGVLVGTDTFSLHQLKNSELFNGK